MDVCAEARFRAIELGKFVTCLLELTLLLKVRKPHTVHVHTSPTGFRTCSTEKEKIFAKRQPVNWVTGIDRKRRISTKDHHGNERCLASTLGRKETHSHDQQDQPDVIAAGNSAGFVDHAEEESRPKGADRNRGRPGPAKRGPTPDHTERDIQCKSGNQEEFEVLWVEYVVSGDECERLEKDEYQDGIAKRGAKDLTGYVGPVLEIMRLVV